VRDSSGLFCLVNSLEAGASATVQVRLVLPNTVSTRGATAKEGDADANRNINIILYNLVSNT
jgi:hypothetical protein